MYNIESILIFGYLDMNMTNDHDRGRCVLNVNGANTTSQITVGAI